MSFSAGVFSLLYDWTTEQASPPIEISKLKAQEQDIATGLSNCILRDGTGIPTAATPWNGQKITGLGNATLVGDAVNASQIQSGGLTKLGSVAGADTITGSFAPVPTAWSSITFFSFVPAGTNTTAVTINVNSLGAKAIVKHNNVALSAGDLKAAVPAICYYDGTSVVLLNPLLAHSANADAAEPGFKGVPQNSQLGGGYTCVLADANKHIYCNASNTYTIPANASVAYPVGTTLMFVNGSSGGSSCTIAITSDTMYLAAGGGATGSRTLASLGIATALKVTSTIWHISGAGLS